MISSPAEYEKMAVVEEKLWWYKILHEKVLEILLLNKIKKEDLILDLGCGTGGLLKKLSDNGYSTLGVDISEYALDFCKKKV